MEVCRKQINQRKHNINNMSTKNDQIITRIL